MSQALIEKIEAEQIKPNLPEVGVGDTVDVHCRIIEGAKERIQVFSGVVLKKQGKGLTATITVRRIVANEGVERTFSVHSPRIAKIEVKRQGHVRRAKLYYLRDRVGKARRLRDKRRGLATAIAPAPEPQATTQAREAETIEPIEAEQDKAPAAE